MLTLIKLASSTLHTSTDLRQTPSMTLKQIRAAASGSEQVRVLVNTAKTAEKSKKIIDFLIMYRFCLVMRFIATQILKIFAKVQPAWSKYSIFDAKVSLEVPGEPGTAPILSDEVSHHRFLLCRRLDTGSAASLDTTKHPSHVSAKLSHDLHSFLILTNLVRSIAMYHIPIL